MAGQYQQCWVVLWIFEEPLALVLKKFRMKKPLFSVLWKEFSIKEPPVPVLSETSKNHFHERGGRMPGELHETGAPSYICQAKLFFLVFLYQTRDFLEKIAAYCHLENQMQYSFELCCWTSPLHKFQFCQWSVSHWVAHHYTLAILLLAFMFMETSFPFRNWEQICSQRPDYCTSQVLHLEFMSQQNKGLSFLSPPCLKLSNLV